MNEDKFYWGWNRPKSDPLHKLFGSQVVTFPRAKVRVVSLGPFFVAWRKRTTMMRIWHKLTSYHWRYDRKSPNSKLAICTCGWHCWMFRRIAWTQRMRSWRCIRGHDWEDDEELWQCSKCYKTKWVDS